MNKRNEKIKEYAKARRVCLWEIGEALGMIDSQFSRYLRKELSAAENEQILRTIDKLATKRD